MATRTKPQKWVVSIDKLKPLSETENARGHPDRNISDIMTSLQEHGQQKPLIVDSDNIIRAGNGTWEAAMKLGWKKIWVTAYKDAFNGPGTETEVELRAYQIRDNRTAELATWKNEVLQADLRWLKEQNVDPEKLGWLKYEADPILQAKFEVPKVDENIPGESFRAPQTMGVPISVTQEQREIFDRAKEKVMEETEQPDTTDGRALELICGDYLGG